MLPYRLKAQINRLRTRWHLRSAVEALSPLEVAGGSLKAEVHMMIGKNHLVRGLAALHTFFGYSGLGDRVGLVFHLDGSVTERQKRWLRGHIPGARFTDFPSADKDVLEVLRNRPYCADYYRRNVSCMVRLIHAPVLARSDRIIQLDSDVAFYRRPDEIVEWVDGQQAPPMYQVDHRSDGDPGPEVRRIFEEICTGLRPGTSVFNIKHYYLNGGLLLFQASRFSFDICEDYLKWHAMHANAKVTHDPAMFWFSEWATEQTAYMLNFATWPDAKILGPKYALGFAPGETSNHFLAKNYYKRESLLGIRESLRKLGASKLCNEGHSP